MKSCTGNIHGSLRSWGVLSHRSLSTWTQILPNPNRICTHATRGGFDDPFKLLNLDSGASEKDIKRSYRQLAKQHHPDVSKNEDDGATFLKLTDAYEFLLAQIHGSSDSESPEGQWDWHDWYWKFRINRTWEKQQRGPNEASESSGGQSSRPQSNGASNPQAKAAVRSQLAGLRQRAAIRSTAKATEEKTPPTEPPVSEADCDHEEDEGCVLPDPPSYVITINTIEEEEEEDPAFRDEGENFSSCGARVRPRRVFVATSGDRENLVGQLHGLKRRATMSSQGP